MNLSMEKVTVQKKDEYRVKNQLFLVTDLSSNHHSSTRVTLNNLDITMVSWSLNIEQC